MSSYTSISPKKLARLGTPKCPSPIDVRADEDVAVDPCYILDVVRRKPSEIERWTSETIGPSVICWCRDTSSEKHNWPSNKMGA